MAFTGKRKLFAGAVCLAVAAISIWAGGLRRSESGVAATHAIEVRQSGQTAIVLYDGPSSSGDGLITARYVANLLGHFGIRPEIVPMGTYVEGMAGRFDVTIACGMQAGTVVPPALIADITGGSRPVCWINRHVGQVIKESHGRFGFEFQDYLDDESFSSVSYHGITLPKADGEINTVKITDPSRVEVLATATNGEETAPYVVRSGSFWYFADSVFSYNTESDRSLVLADLLHDILGKPHEQERRAMVRIEDVSADSDPDDLRRMADVLSSRGIPFQVALIPIFKDPSRRIELYLSDHQDIVDALHYMVERGGTIILHGTTHQLHGTSADDFEFWDSLTSRPAAGASQAAIRLKLESALEECFRARLYPVAWETPHYAASIDHYRALSPVFSHVYERRMVTDDEGTQQYFPYEATDWTGQMVIPENLGYVNGDNPQSEPIVRAADRLLAVRDPIASFFFHPYLSSRYLVEVLNGLERDGYRFISARDFGCSVELGDYFISTSPSSFRTSPAHPILKIAAIDRRGVATEKYEDAQPGRMPRLEPPPGGLVAVQGVQRRPPDPPKHGLLDRAAEWWTGNDPDQLPSPRTRAQSVILIDPENGNQDGGYEGMLRAYGIPVARVPVSRIEEAMNSAGDAVIIVPEASAARLSGPAAGRLVQWIEQGGRAVIEGRSELAEKLGFVFTRRRTQIAQVHDFLFPDQEITWSHPEPVEWFESPPVSTTLMEDMESRQPVSVAARAGDGVVVFLATALDSPSGLGYSRYPYLFHHLRQRFGLEPRVIAHGAEFYFDPGYREQAPVERLVASWQRDGIRAVYVAAWHFYPKWSYDYGTLIRMCHERGIAVYAWFELPQVSDKFWNDHPEWREKTATGRDAGVGWRKMMNLANDRCRGEAFAFVSDLMAAHDWDGMNIAELAFDTRDGLLDPDGYTPMNDDVRSRFAGQSGFDPKLLFDPGSRYYWKRNAGALSRWSAFRSGLTRQWLIELLDRMEGRNLDIICTVYDSLHSPRVTERTGTDTRDTIALMDRYRFTIQVEDPAEKWGESPVRYREFGETYRRLVRDPSRLMFDINAVTERAAGQSATRLMSGTELALAVSSAAAAGNGRVGLYSESTLLPQDRSTLQFVFGSAAEVYRAGDAVTVKSPGTMLLRTGSGDRTEEKPVVLDGAAWPCRERGDVLIPAGEHTISASHPDLFERIRISSNVTSRLTDITADVRQVVKTDRGIEIDYCSPRRAWVTLARRPQAVSIDRRVAEVHVSPAKGGGWMVELPAGAHLVEITDRSTVSATVDMAGFVSSSVIVSIGAGFTVLLFGLYSCVRMRRIWLRAKGHRVRK